MGPLFTKFFNSVHVHLSNKLPFEDNNGQQALLPALKSYFPELENNLLSVGFSSEKIKETLNTYFKLPIFQSSVILLINSDMFLRTFKNCTL